MYKVSDEYKASIKSSLRERAYIMLSFGLVNQEAQARARIEDGNFTRYTNTANLFGKKTDDTIYATLEENFTKVDGSMFFLPRGTAVGGYYDTGLVSNNLTLLAFFNYDSVSIHPRVHSFASFIKTDEKSMFFQKILKKYMPFEK